MAIEIPGGKHNLDMNINAQQLVLKIFTVYNIILSYHVYIDTTYVYSL